ncbi:ThuA domain-containing protein [Micromonospora marina]|uniref:Type 1 glutamine amidotransferase (GATase1) n=1 Tax=Micromonospora marina TaxID=307120 RepID=A0A1C4VCT8_9ACTN|nr:MULTISPECIES: ThuA domain-containing protein [Micromonospora]SCE81814.1 Type 1 glutamine amidotransferase (GATase1) [Micromonospora marina]
MKAIRLSATLAAVLLLVGGLAPSVSAADPAYQVLVFSKTAGFRHGSIAAGVQAVRDLGAANNFTVTATEDANTFTTANLAQFEAVVFLNTTGDVLNTSQQDAFQAYIEGGGGFVGVHAAADTEHGWPWYGQLVGARFVSHPAVQSAQVRVESRAHAATAHLPQTWTRTDEWYNYHVNPRSSARVLASLNETSYSGGTMGDHPIVWCRSISAGRSFYTGGGHTDASFTDPTFRTHLLGGIRYAAGFAKFDCRAETGYTTLYGGSTAGWTQAGPGGFTNSDATLSSFGGRGVYWHSAKAFRSYSLKLDWRLAGSDDSGVMIGADSTSGTTPAGGYEVQIGGSGSANQVTGAVYGAKAPNASARDAALNPPGSWNTYELLVEGERIRVFLNGVQINDFTSTDQSRSLQGYIGVQNSAAGDGVAFRNIRIRELVTSVKVEGESYSMSSGVQIANHSSASGGKTVGYVNNGDWVGYAAVSAAGRTSFSARVSSATAGGTIEVRSGSATGALLGSVAVPGTGGWGTFTTVSTALSSTGTGSLHLVFKGGGGYLFDVDWLSLDGG